MWYRGGALEDGSNLRIHLHHDVFLIGHFSVPLLNPLFDPSVEWLAYHSVCDVGYILSRILQQLPLDGEPDHDLIVVLRIIYDVVNGQPLELRDCDVLDLLALGDLLLSSK